MFANFITFFFFAPTPFTGRGNICEILQLFRQFIGNRRAFKLSEQNLYFELGIQVFHVLSYFASFKEMI